MAKVRCKQTNVGSFFGNFLYDQKVSKNHFLRKPIYPVPLHRIYKACYSELSYLHGA